MQWRRLAPVIVVAAALVLGACLESSSQGSTGRATGRRGRATTVAPPARWRSPVTAAGVTEAPVTDAPTTAAPTTTAAPSSRCRWPATCARACGATTSRWLQQRLVDLKFDPGAPDGAVRPDHHAGGVGLPEAGHGGDGQGRERHRHARAVGPHAGPARHPAPPAQRHADPHGGVPARAGGRAVQGRPAPPHHPHLDRQRQGVVRRAHGRHEGAAARPSRPGGTYKFYRRQSDWWEGDLGRMYNPVYFNYGIAVHGMTSVPNYPASHGCVRIPMHIAEYFPSLVKQRRPGVRVGRREGAGEVRRPAAAVRHGRPERHHDDHHAADHDGAEAGRAPRRRATPAPTAPPTTPAPAAAADAAPHGTHRAPPTTCRPRSRSRRTDRPARAARRQLLSTVSGGPRPAPRRSVSTNWRIAASPRVVGQLADVGLERVVVEVLGRRRRRRLAGHHLLDHRGQALGLGRAERLVALGELGQHLAAEHLDRLHDVLVAVAAGLQHEDHLVDAGLLVAAQVAAHLLGRADGAPQAGACRRRPAWRRASPPSGRGRRPRGRSPPRPRLARYSCQTSVRPGGARRRRRSGRASSRRSWRPRCPGGWPSPRRGAASSASRRPPAG